MPRHASRTGSRLTNHGTPIQRFDRLDLASKLICYKYYLGLTTGNEEGWNPKEAGSVFHQRSSRYLLTQGTASWFRHKGKQIVSLAQAFVEANERVPETQAPDTAAAAPIPPPSVSREAAPFAFTPAPAPAPAPSTPLRPQPDLSAMNTPNRAASPGAIRFNNDAATLNNDNHMSLPVPTCYGSYKKFNYTTRVATEHVMVRKIIHNGVNSEDVTFEWLNPKLLKLRVPGKEPPSREGPCH